MSKVRNPLFYEPRKRIKKNENQPPITPTRMGRRKTIPNHKNQIPNQRPNPPPPRKPRQITKNQNPSHKNPDQIINIHNEIKNIHAKSKISTQSQTSMPSHRNHPNNKRPRRITLFSIMKHKDLHQRQIRNQQN